MYLGYEWPVKRIDVVIVLLYNVPAVLKDAGE